MLLLLGCSKCKGHDANGIYNLKGDIFSTACLPSLHCNSSLNKRNVSEVYSI